LKNKKLMFYLFNWFSFYIYWYLCFWGAKNESFYIGPIIGFGFILIHIILVENRLIETKYIFLCLLLGFVLDSFFINLGLIHYKGQLVISDISLAPIWILTLWAGFGTTVFYSLKWMKKRYFLTSLIGIIIFPIIYFSADRYGSIEINEHSFGTYFIISVSCSIVITLLIFISDRREI